MEIFNIDQNSVPIPEDFITNISEITFNPNTNDVNFLKGMVRSYREVLCGFKIITQHNIEGFAKIFIEYKYLNNALLFLDDFK